MYIAYIKEMTEKVIQLKQFIAQVSTPSIASPAEDRSNDSVLVVVDTAKGKVNTGVVSETNNPNKIVIKKDYRKLSSAIDQFQTSYKNVNLSRMPSTMRLQR